MHFWGESPQSDLANLASCAKFSSGRFHGFSLIHNRYVISIDIFYTDRNVKVNEIALEWSESTCVQLVDESENSEVSI